MTENDSTPAASLPEGFLINGDVVAASTFTTIVNPATGEEVGPVPQAGAAELELAVAGARRALTSWASDENARREALHAAANVLEQHAEELAHLVVLETGKPFGAAMMEPMGAAHHFRWIADAEVPAVVLNDEENHRTELVFRPVGVVAGIIPWNVPMLMALHKFAAAARMGNTVILKPSPYTPLATLRVGELLKDVFPAGVLNVISGGDELGRSLVEHTDIDMIGFTGSTATGRRIMASAAPTLKRLSLELGGNDAAIVLDDADVDQIAERIFGAAFILSGQVCQAIKRLYVHSSVYDSLVTKLTEIAEQQQLGSPFDPQTTFGPLMTGEQYNRVIELAEGVEADGGTFRTGGKPVEGPGYFFPPTIVEGLSDDARLVVEEQFGPLLPVIPFDDVEDVIARANATEYGLMASVWSSDMARARGIAERLRAGSVCVNRHAAIAPDMPFGGVGASGFGREGGIDGLKNYAQLVTIDLESA